MTDRPTREDAAALLEATLDAVHDAILVAGLDRRIIRHNRRASAIFGLADDQWSALTLDGLVDALAPQLENADELRASSARIWRDPSREAVDVFRFNDGRVFERFVAPHQVDSTLLGVVVSFREVSEAARAEQALNQHRAFLEQAQQIAHIGSWVAELDGSDRLGWSAETHRIFGVPIGSFSGASARFFEFVHPDDRAAVRAAFEGALDGRRPCDVEHRIVLADGQLRWVHERANIVRGADGRPVRMIGTVQDITERHHLAEQLRQSQKMEAIGRLAGGIAHDLNNALTAIGGYAELALAELPADHVARGDVEEVRRAAERAASVTRQLLAFSRKQLLEPRVFDINDTVGGLGRLLDRLLGTDIELATRIGADVPPIVADPGQVEQAIINLAVNARDAMPLGGRLTLSTSFDEVDEAFARANPPIVPGRYVVVTVSDTGEGMPSETKAQIFEPFFTTKAAGKGTGLGLSMVYGTVKQSGGFIFVESEVGRGTTFRMFFPPADAARADPAAAAPRATVLIVEDEPAVRKLVATTLKDEPYRLLLAESAEQATAMSAESSRIDLLLTDAIMPGQNGIELASALVAARPGLRVIVMSGYTEDAIRAKNLGYAVSVLRKPFTPRELRQRVREALAPGGGSGVVS